MILSLLVVQVVRADCEHSLTICETYAKVLEKEQTLLQQKVVILSEQLAKSEDNTAAADKEVGLPAWAWFLIGAGTGVSVYTFIKR